MKRRYDYEALAEVEPSLRKHIKQDSGFEYDNPDAIRRLNRALLKSTYELDLILPAGHLCPTVDNRSRYISLLETILFRIFQMSKDCKLHGIDIGTGASCIYPLIAVTRNPSWSFTGVDVDNDILAIAKENISRNRFDEKICLVYNSNSNVVYPPSLLENLVAIESDKFLLCNPPFFSSIEDATRRREAKAHQPLASGNEIAYAEAVHSDGGELGFVCKLIAGSERIARKHKIRLFSCLLGLKESFIEVLNLLKSRYRSCSFAYEMIKISHTCRWIVFWSFTDALPTELNGRLKVGAMASGVQILECSLSEEQVVTMLSNYGTFEKVDNAYLLSLHQNTWSRRARRSGPEVIPEPIVVEVSFSENEVQFFFETNSNLFWDIFVGFVEHLRKIKH